VHRAISVVVLAVLAGSIGLAVAPVAEARTVPAHATNGKLVHQRLKSAISSLKVATEAPSGYKRAKFRLWTDQDGDCRNTRAEVLGSESKAKTTGTCTIKTGRWKSAYDGRTYTSASKLDIDHVVPLREAWSSGAKKWSAARRTAYANDLADSHTLIAVSLTKSRSKGDREPGKWMPAKGRCAYITSWVIVKVRWGLTVDKREKALLLTWATTCKNPVITTHLAVVKKASSSSDSTTGGTTGGTSGGIDPQFSTCTAAKAAGYGPYRSGVDPEYGWYEDRDHDGIVCE